MKKLIVALIISCITLVSVNSVLAVTQAEIPPVCPSLASANNFSFMGNNWQILFFKTNATPFTGGAVVMGDRAVDKSYAINLAKAELSGPVTGRAIRVNSSNGKQWFWSCSSMDGNYRLLLGVTEVAVFSPYYDINNALSATQNSDAQKLQQLRLQQLVQQLSHGDKK